MLRPVGDTSHDYDPRVLPRLERCPSHPRLRLSKNWRDLGDLKRGLLDIWTEERNTYAKEVMKDIEAQR